MPFVQQPARVDTSRPPAFPDYSRRQTPAWAAPSDRSCVKPPCPNGNEQLHNAVRLELNLSSCFGGQRRQIIARWRSAIALSHGLDPSPPLTVNRLLAKADGHHKGVLAASSPRRSYRSIFIDPSKRTRRSQASILRWTEAVAELLGATTLNQPAVHLDWASRLAKTRSVISVGLELQRRRQLRGVHPVMPHSIQDHLLRSAGGAIVLRPAVAE